MAMKPFPIFDCKMREELNIGFIPLRPQCSFTGNEQDVHLMVINYKAITMDVVRDAQSCKKLKVRTKAFKNLVGIEMTNVHFRLINSYYSYVRFIFLLITPLIVLLIAPLVVLLIKSLIVLLITPLIVLLITPLVVLLITLLIFLLITLLISYIDHTIGCFIDHTIVCFID